MIKVQKSIATPTKDKLNISELSLEKIARHETDMAGILGSILAEDNCVLL